MARSMEDWLFEVVESLEKALEIAVSGDIVTENLYMLAPIIYSQKHHMNNDALLNQMAKETESQALQDASVDPESKSRYKFHYVSSYLYCFVVSGKIDEFKYDQIMEYVNDEIDLFS